eukprot:scaffold1246_cov134-Cylindrotheca_fusiformis.AAC.6
MTGADDDWTEGALYILLAEGKSHVQQFTSVHPSSEQGNGEVVSRFLCPSNHAINKCYPNRHTINDYKTPRTTFANTLHSTLPECSFHSRSKPFCVDTEFCPTGFQTMANLLRVILIA